MTSKTKEQIWVEMSIREIWTQCHYAEIAYKNITIKSINPIDTVFSSVHSFLSHCANVSKLLLSSPFYKTSKKIGGILLISDNSIINDRRLRNHIEHYDERIKSWIRQMDKVTSIGTYNIGPKTFLSGNITFIKHYDPNSTIFTFIDEDFDLYKIYKESQEIKKKADNWVQNLEWEKRSLF